MYVCMYVCIYIHIYIRPYSHNTSLILITPSPPRRSPSPPRLLPRERPGESPHLPSPPPSALADDNDREGTKQTTRAKKKIPPHLILSSTTHSSLSLPHAPLPHQLPPPPRHSQPRRRWCYLPQSGAPRNHASPPQRAARHHLPSTFYLPRPARPQHPPMAGGVATRYGRIRLRGLRGDDGRYAEEQSGIARQGRGRVRLRGSRGAAC